MHHPNHDQKPRPQQDTQPSRTKSKTQTTTTQARATVAEEETFRDVSFRATAHSLSDAMIRETQIIRLDGLMLCASIDETTQANPSSALTEIKQQTRQVMRKLSRTSEPQASIQSGPHTLHYLIDKDIIFLAICDASYPRKLAFTYLSDLAHEFHTTHPAQAVQSPVLRPYAYMDFDNFIAKTRTTYADSRASQNLDKLHDELKDVTKVMTKNIEDLLYRGDSLDKMGEMSSRLRDDSKKYRRAAVRINWELLLKQYGPFAALGFFALLFVYMRFF
ncbi:hypothetical protein E4U54_007422 [Claviceps lovelessii]|nr:hypothetical protein E4U54_007422 [Claviceps lovelessii]